MESTYYLYSKFYAWFGLILFSLFVVGILFVGVAGHDIRLLLFCVFLALAACAFLYYNIRVCFIPAIKNYIALELDAEKAHCYITDSTVYWRDVVEISESYDRYSSFIKFDMVDNSVITMPTKWIHGRNSRICNTMQEYFAKTL